MDELVRLVAQKTGIAEEQARTAVTTVLGFLKDRLPPAIATHLDGVVEGKGMPDDIAKGLGGLFGKS